MSTTYSHRFITITVLSIVVACTLGLSGCAKNQLPPIRADIPLASGAQLSPDESRRMENLPAEEVLQRGQLALANGDYQMAAVYFSTVLKKEPQSVPARLGLGQAALAAGDYGSARTLINEVLSVESDSVPALTARGRILSASGQLDGAIADFSRSLEKEPNNSAVLTELAMTCDRIPERVVEAEPLYRKVLEFSPDSAAARNNLGFNFLLQGRAEEAVTILSGALALDTKNPRILANLATAYLLKGDKAKALQLFRQTVGEAEAYNNIGYLYMTQSRWDEAENALRKALELSPRYYVRAAANLERLQEMRVAARDNRSSN
ncbi:MAG: tetratricopeptide repeat protein [Desulfuromonadales bacterium]|nr:tetratricopeptide repeat protein [Desulfuromonadales bacterium]